MYPQKPNGITRLAHSLFNPGAGTVENRDRKRIFSLYLLIALVPFVVLGAVHAMDGLLHYVIIDCLVAVIIVVFLLLLPRLKTGKALFRIALSVLMTLLSYWLVTGAVDGHSSIWVLTMPSFAFFLLGRREGLAWTAVMSLIVVAVFFNPLGLAVYAYSQDYFSRHLIAFFVIVLFTYNYESVRERFKRAMESEQEKLLVEKERLAGTQVELRRHRDHLEELVAERTAQLRRNIGELEASENKFRLLADNISDLIWTMDMDLRFTFMTPSVHGMFGYTVEEAIALPIDKWSTPESNEWVFGELAKELELENSGTADPNRVAVFEIRQVKKDGTPFWVEIRASFIRDGAGGAIGFVGMTRDIEARKRAESALRESEEQLRILSDNLAEGMVYQINTGRDGRQRVFTYLSPAVERLHGRKLEDVLKNPGLIYEQFDDDFQSQVEESEARAIATMSRFDIDAPVRLPSGEVRWRRFSSSPRRQSDGTLIWDGIEFDITDQKRAEEERNSLQVRLQRAEKMEALGTLAGGVAHDLNNVLGVLVGYSELLLLDHQTDNRMREHIEQIMKSGERAAAIVQDLLSLARRGVHTEQVINLNAVIGDFRKTPEFENLSALHRGVRIEVDLAKNLKNIRGSSAQISKTIMNLLNNAAEAMRDGGTVRLITGNRVLEKPVRGYDHVREGEYAVLSVSDTGEGISAEDLNHIFEPFYTNKVMGRSGTGLGLAVVWGTVKDHDGYIDIKSEKGKGSTFTIYFPVTRDDVPLTPEVVPLSAYLGNEESVLVVDDIKEQRELASRMLGMLNYRVVTAQGGEEAVEYLKEHRADLVLLDMIMHPGMDGLETYRCILEIHPGQKTVIVSGYSESDRVREAQALGAGGYVRKPYVLEKLGLAVKKELGREHGPGEKNPDLEIS